MKAIKIINIILLFIILVCCKEKVHEEIMIDTSNIEVEKNVCADSIVESVSYIPLETKESCLISNIKNLIIYDSLVYILNRTNGDEELLIFNLEGAFVQKVGTMGNGPDEYLAIAGFCINPYDKTIELFDQLKKKKHKYNLIGEYIKSTNISVNCSLTNKIRYISENKLIVVNDINSFGEPLIYVCDGDLNHVKIIYDPPLKFDGGYQYAKNPISDYSNFLIVPLSNKVFEISNNDLKSVYNILISSKYLPANEVKEGGEYEEIMSSVKEKGFIQFYSIFETSTSLLVEDFNYTIIINKKSNKGIAFESLNPSNNILPFSTSSFLCVYNDSFVGVLTSSDLETASEYYKKNNVVPTSVISNLIHYNEFDLNPILCIYHLK